MENTYDAAAGDRSPAPKIAATRFSAWGAMIGCKQAFMELGVGVFVALIAVGVRASLPLAPQQLPTITLVIALAIVTTYVGARAGISCALTGAVLTWSLVFNPFSWSTETGSWIPLLGFGVIASVIITTSHLYRTSQRERFDRELLEREEQTKTAELFANELAHRLKNALAVVQSIAMQTLDREAPETHAFTDRLRALARANDLLTEHVSEPTATLRDTVETCLKPFHDQQLRFNVQVSQDILSGQQAISLSLTLHELATNAMKYGALTLPGGCVHISSDDKGDCTRLTWKECGGPTVMPPQKAGFGTRMIRRSGANSYLVFDPDGLTCTLELAKS